MAAPLAGLKAMAMGPKPMGPMMPDDEEAEGETPLVSAMGDFLSAFKAEDPTAMADAFEAAMSACSSKDKEY